MLFNELFNGHFIRLIETILLFVLVGLSFNFWFFRSFWLL